MKASGPGTMDHRYIDEFDVAVRYLERRLDPEDETAFEDHFVDCPECLDRLELARKFQTGLAAAVSVSALNASQKPLRAGAPPPWRAWAVAAGIVLCFGLAAATVRMLTLRRDLARATAATSAVEHQYEESQRQASDLQKQLGERSRPAPLPANPPVFALSLVRGSGADAGAPSVLIAFPAAPPPWIVLLLEVPDTPFPNYRATVAAPSGRTVWQQSDLTTAAPGELAVALPSAALPTGDYSLQLEGGRRASDFKVLARYRFRVTVGR